MSSYARTLWLASIMRDVITNANIVKTIKNGYPREGQDKIVLPVLNNSFTAQSDKSADTSFNDANKSFKEIVLDKVAYCGWAAKRLELLDTDTSLRDELRKEASETLVKSVENAVITAVMNGIAAGNKLTFDGVIDGATTLTYEMLLAIEEKFNEANIPRDNRYMMIGAKMETKLKSMKDSTDTPVFISVDRSGSTILTGGTLGKVLSFNVLTSNDVPKTSDAGVASGSGTKNAALFYHRDVIGYGSERSLFMPESTYNKTKRQYEDIVELSYGYGILRDTYGITLRED